MLAAVVVLFLTVISAGSCEVLLRQPPDLRGHRRREQRDVLVVGGVREDRLDVLGEAHVEHLVGLVEHQEPQLGQVERALLQVVHDPAGGADDDVHAAAQARTAARRTPGRRRPAARARRAVWAAYFSNASQTCSASSRVGRQHQRLRALLLEVEPVEDRQRERRGLAGAGLREADHVAALEQGRDGRGLDRRRGLVADVAQRPEHRLVETEVVEGGLGGGRLVRHTVHGRASRPRHGIRRRGDVRHSTVTDFARLRGLSMSWPRCRAA